ncbi:hypothetical protein SAY86_010155 [Trapa natans]|uniref:Uncharacterized protein n=1 Tax=Trapa natans TaxID=22666 RepID=A0AAN7QTK9_TRANT|nr:hypothetical protein SAY86_010155 [Trapa natans]
MIDKYFIFSLFKSVFTFPFNWYICYIAFRREDSESPLEVGSHSYLEFMYYYYCISIEEELLTLNFISLDYAVGNEKSPRIYLNDWWWLHAKPGAIYGKLFCQMKASMELQDLRLSVFLQSSW